VPRPPQNRASGSHRTRLKQAGQGRPVRRDPSLRRPSVRSPPKRRPTCPRVLTPHRPLHRAHLTLSAPFRVRARRPYPASYPTTTPMEGRRTAVLGFLSPFGIPAFASGSSCPARGVGPPLRSGYRHTASLAGPQRGFHVPHEQDTTGVGALSAPRTTVLTRPASSLRSVSAPAASQRPVPRPRWSVPSAGLHVTRHHRGFTGVHPSGLPLHLWPLDGTATLGLDRLSFAPRRCQRRTSGWGQAVEHKPGLHLRHVDLQSMYPLNSCDLVSHPQP
jgi:hypothetical protein